MGQRHPLVAVNREQPDASAVPRLSLLKTTRCGEDFVGLDAWEKLDLVRVWLAHLHAHTLAVARPRYASDYLEC